MACHVLDCGCVCYFSCDEIDYTSTVTAAVYYTWTVLLHGDSSESSFWSSMLPPRKHTTPVSFVVSTAALGFGFSGLEQGFRAAATAFGIKVLRCKSEHAGIPEPEEQWLHGPRRRGPEECGGAHTDFVRGRLPDRFQMSSCPMACSCSGRMA